MEKPIERSLQESELRYRRLFEAAQDGILILDAQSGAITDVNPYLIHMLGYSRDEFLKKKLWELGDFQDTAASENAFRTLQKHGYIRYMDLPLRAEDGRLLQVEFVSNVYLEDDEKVIQCNIRDNAKRVQASNPLVVRETIRRKESVRDRRTGLVNRSFMEESLNRELLRAARKHISLGIMMLGVNGFKELNLAYGPLSGDAVLRELGAMLLLLIRGEDIVCRFGEDTFIVVLPEATRSVTYRRAERIYEYTKNSRLQIGGQVLEEMTFSLGVAVFPEDGATGTALLKAAQAALTLAKQTVGQSAEPTNGKSKTPLIPKKRRSSTLAQ